MKKRALLFLLLTAFIGFCTFIAYNETGYVPLSEVSASAAEDSSLQVEDAEMNAVKFYRENKGSAFLYELRPPFGNVIPYGVSRYAPTMCYYPLGSKGEMERPEMYTWGSGTIGVDGDYVMFKPSGKSDMRITFDTSPASYYMDYAKPFFTVVLKTTRAFEGTIGFRTLDSAYRKYFPVSFTGKWQKIILDLSDPDGWERRNSEGEYHPYYKTPFSEELGKLYGGHTMHLAGTESTSCYLFDYIMMFDSLEKATAFDGLAEVSSTSLCDVPDKRTIFSAKARPAVRFLGGYADGTIRPNASMTRAEAAAVLARLMDSESVISELKETAFTDVSDKEWYFGYVAYLEKYGVTDIFGDKFEPEKPVTRAEFVAMLTRAGAFEPATAKSEVSFGDVNSETAYGAEILAAAGSGAITGYTDGNFAPDRFLSRAEIATVLTRVLDISPTPEKPQIFSDLDARHWAYGNIMSVIASENVEAGKLKISEIDGYTEERIAEIRNSPTTVVPSNGGTAYYVSTSGDDSNDGKSPESPWQTLAKVSNHTYNKGDVVYFKRGDIFRVPADSDVLRITQGVSYSAYGIGDKPRIYGSPEDGADSSKWTLYDAKHNIWRYERQMIDQGTLIFNDGESWASTVQMYFKNGGFTNVDGTPFDMTKSLNKDLSIFCETVPSGGDPIPSTTRGWLYLRCDKGNPGEVFDSIEFMPSRHIVRAQQSNYHFKDTVIENLCIMYGGAHGIHATSSTNFTVKYCEFGYIGGGHQSFTSTTGIGALNGRGVRFGNAVETGYCDGYYVNNNYIYQCYDCGITFQSTNRDIQNLDIHFDDNVIENCQYSIEYWMNPANKDVSKYYIYDYTISRNIMRNAGVGLSQLRPDKNSAAHIKGWSKYNAVKDNSYIISDNIFDRSRDMMVHIGLPSLTADFSKPIMRGNVWIQHVSEEDSTSSFGEYGLSGTKLSYTDGILDTFKKQGIEDTEVYFVK